jgi:hypothetical protein
MTYLSEVLMRCTTTCTTASSWHQRIGHAATRLMRPLEESSSPSRQTPQRPFRLASFDQLAQAIIPTAAANGIGNYAAAGSLVSPTRQGIVRATPQRPVRLHPWDVLARSIIPTAAANDFGNHAAADSRAPPFQRSGVGNDASSGHCLAVNGLDRSTALVATSTAASSRTESTGTHQGIGRATTRSTRSLDDSSTPSRRTRPRLHEEQPPASPLSNHRVVPVTETAIPTEVPERHLSSLVAWIMEGRWEEIQDLIVREPVIALARFKVSSAHMLTTILHQAIRKEFGRAAGALCHDARVNLINYILDVHPTAITIKDNRGTLPLHVIFHASVEIKEELHIPLAIRMIDMYPTALMEQGGKNARLPLHNAVGISSNKLENAILHMLRVTPHAVSIVDRLGLRPIEVAVSYSCTLQILKELLNVHHIIGDDLDVETLEGLLVIAYDPTDKRPKRHTIEFLTELVEEENRRSAAAAVAPALPPPAAASPPLAAALDPALPPPPAAASPPAAAHFAPVPPPPAAAIQQDAGGEDDVCPICLDSIAPEQECVIDSCQHSFCYNCIKESAKESNKCPLCQRRFHSIAPVQAAPARQGVLTRRERRMNRQIAVEDRDPQYWQWEWVE